MKFPLHDKSAPLLSNLAKASDFKQQGNEQGQKHRRKEGASAEKSRVAATR